MRELPSLPGGDAPIHHGAPSMPLPRHAWAIARSLLLALMLPTTAHAATCAAPPSPPTQEQWEQWRAQATNRGLLWRITKNGRSSWLYGTVHAARPEWVVPGPAVNEALRASNVLALELDPLDPAILQRVSALISQHAGQMPPAIAARVRTQVEQACLPITLVDALHPMMVLTTVQMVELRRDGIYTEYGIDQALSGIARKLGKPVISMETPEGQFRALLGDDLTVNTADVSDTLKEMESGRNRKVTRELLAAWSSGDLRRLSDYQKWCDCVNTASERTLLKRIVDDRNGGLADTIDKLHTEGKQVFAAAGALHLVGQTGLPTLLAARGYRVEFIQP